MFYSNNEELLIGKERAEMKKTTIWPMIAAAALLAGCGSRVSNVSEAHLRSSSIPPAAVTTAATTAAVTASATEETSGTETSPTSARAVSTAETSAATEQTVSQTQAVTTTSAAETETVTSAEPLPTETTTEATVTEPVYDTFYGVLIDEDCSDFEDPPLHDTPCMFMKECRESGYGLDIKQEDGSWVFYMFDENGQELAWEYLNITERQDGLFVTVTGRWEDNVIKVISIEES